MELIIRAFGYELTLGKLVEEPSDYVGLGADLDINPEAVEDLGVTARGYGFTGNY